MKNKHLNRLVLRWAGICMSLICSSCGPIPTDTSSKATVSSANTKTPSSSLVAKSGTHSSAGSCLVDNNACIDYIYYSGSLTTAQNAAATSCKKGGYHSCPVLQGTYRTKACDQTAPLNGYCDFYTQFESGVLLRTVEVFREMSDEWAKLNCGRFGSVYSKALPDLDFSLQ